MEAYLPSLKLSMPMAVYFKVFEFPFFLLKIYFSVNLDNFLKFGARFCFDILESTRLTHLPNFYSHECAKKPNIALLLILLSG